MCCRRVSRPGCAASKTRLIKGNIVCGIAGIIYLNRDRPVEEKILQAMTGALAHRGPDGEGYWTGKSIGFGHRRLAIIDLEGGRQPLSNEDQSVWVIYNGEIYNYRELTDELKQKGHRFQTRSDTEVIVHAYEEYGTNSFKHFQGMFSFALWDERRRTLFLVRDPVGIKPLFYYTDSEKILFASEIKAFLKHPAFKIGINWCAIDSYLTYGFIPAPQTVYQNCFKLKPGHFASISDGKIKVQSYWDIQDSNPVISTSDFQSAVKEVRELLFQAVTSNLVSDVPLGALLSGGLDSSTVVAIMAKKAGQPVSTFNIGFEDPAYDESSYATTVSDYFRTQHYFKKVQVQPEDILGKIVSIFDEPFGDASAVPTFYLSQIVREKVKVALAGDGGDENFGGYRRYWIDLGLNRFRPRIPNLFKNIFYGLGVSAEYISSSPYLKKMSTFLKQTGLSEPEGYYHTVSLLKPEEKKWLYTPDFQSQIKDESPYRSFLEHYNRFADLDPLSRMIYADIQTFLPDDYLTKVDRTSMFHGLEVRVPMLDTRLLSYTFFMPAFYKIRGSRSKIMLREAMKDLLPPTVLSRNKMGFEVPLNSWLKGALRQTVEEKLFRTNGCVSSLLDKSELQKLWGRFLRGAYPNAHLFWALLVLELWQDNQ